MRKILFGINTLPACTLQEQDRCFINFMILDSRQGRDQRYCKSKRINYPVTERALDCQSLALIDLLAARPGEDRRRGGPCPSLLLGRFLLLLGLDALHV